MSNNKTLELLLNSNKEDFAKATLDVEVPRLSKIFGEQFLFTCKSLTVREYAEIQEEIDIDSKGNISAKDVNIMTLIKSIPELSNKSLRDHFGAVTPKDLIDKLLNPGEVSALASTILELSGFNEDAVKEMINEVKN